MVILNVADVFPAGIVTVVGTFAFATLLETDTTAPEGPAGPFRVTVPTEEAPPFRVAGLILSDSS